MTDPTDHANRVHKAARHLAMAAALLRGAAPDAEAATARALETTEAELMRVGVAWDGVPW